MTAGVFLADLRQRGVELQLDDGKIRYAGPPGAFTDADRAMIREYRSELVALLSQPKAWADAYSDLEDDRWQAVVDADIAAVGYYTPTRNYATPAETPEAIWARCGLLPRSSHRA